MATPAGPLQILPFDYPPKALRAGEQGRVGYSVTISAEGKVKRCAVVMSSGFVRLDHSTCSVLARATANPATRDGQPVATIKAGVMNWAIPSRPAVTAVPASPQ